MGYMMDWRRQPSLPRIFGATQHDPIHVELPSFPSTNSNRKHIIDDDLLQCEYMGRSRLDFPLGRRWILGRYLPSDSTFRRPPPTPPPRPGRFVSTICAIYLAAMGLCAFF